MVKIKEHWFHWMTLLIRSAFGHITCIECTYDVRILYIKFTGCKSTSRKRKKKYYAISLHNENEIEICALRVKDSNNNKKNELTSREPKRTNKSAHKYTKTNKQKPTIYPNWIDPIHCRFSLAVRFLISVFFSSFCIHRFLCYACYFFFFPFLSFVISFRSIMTIQKKKSRTFTRQTILILFWKQ